MKYDAGERSAVVAGVIRVDQLAGRPLTLGAGPESEELLVHIGCLEQLSVVRRVNFWS